tara:strand:- start:1392 stop:1853 length:462 start_codon:yes stop_codon:yes gene_type:complete
MKLKVETNFDFGKLASKLDNILDDVVDDSKRVYRVATRENLKSGKLRKLRPTSIENRKRGNYGFGKKAPKTSSTKPLVWTGRLLNSIQVKDEGIEMMKYGMHHNDGFNIGSTPVAPRPFLAIKGKRIAGTKYGKEYEKFINKMYKRIRKALKK